MDSTEQELDRRMGRLLQIGVLAAAAVMLIGGFIYLFVKPEPLPDYRHFHSSVESIRSIPRMFRHAFLGDAAALIQVGTLIMIATPVARVVFAVYAFGRRHDLLYVGISSIVLVLLLYGLFFGS
jgi:uncharacterized membrane protein